MKKVLRSPLYKDDLVDRIEVFKTTQICDAYKSIGVDIARFFIGITHVELFECRKTGYRFYYPFSTIGDAISIKIIPIS